MPPSDPPRIVVAVSAGEADRLLPTECSFCGDGVMEVGGGYTGPCDRCNGTARNDPVQSVLSLTRPVDDGATIGLLIEQGRYMVPVGTDHPALLAMGATNLDEGKLLAHPGRWVLVGEVTATRCVSPDVQYLANVCGIPPIQAEECLISGRAWAAVLDPAAAVRYATPQTDRPCPSFVGGLHRRRLGCICDGSGRVGWSAQPTHQPIAIS